MSDLNDNNVPAGQMHGEILFPPSWQGLRQQIVYLAQFGNSIQVIHADGGGGKTSFYRHLLATGLGSVTVGVTVTEGAGLMVFFRDVLQDLGLRPDSRATLGELVASLRGYVQTLHKERSRAVLLVDDAHYLTESELGALVSTLQGQADAGVGLHVVLFAEPGLAARIDALQVLDVAVHDAPLPVFSAAEVHQLLVARHSGVGAEQAQRIWYQSRGLPGAVMEAIAHSQPSKQTADTIMSLRGLPIGHIAALLILCGVLVWAFLVRQADEPPQGDTFPPPIGPASPATIPPVAPPLSSPATERPSTSSVNGESSVPVPLGKEEPNADVPPLSPRAGVNFDELSDEEGAAAESGKPSAADVSEVPQSPPTAPPVVAPREVLRPSSALDRSEERSLVDAGAAHLLALPPNAYVLQLMAASAEDKLATYVADQPNKAHLHAYKTKRDDKVLYILVEGFYADRASAQAAVLNLPTGQREGGPWPKKIEQIHQEIRKSR